MNKSVDNTSGYEPDEKSSDTSNGQVYEITEEMLEAGEAVLREKEPDCFLGWPKGSHYHLVSNIVSAVFQASCIDADVRIDTVSRPWRLR